jgi:hypothetical protein
LCRAYNGGMNSIQFKRKVEIEKELAAISQAFLDIIEGGQSVTIGDMSYTEVSLGALHAREKSLRFELGRIDGTKPAIVPVNFGSMPR